MKCSVLTKEEQKWCKPCHPDCPHLKRTPREEKKIQVVKDIGFYSLPTAGGYIGWIKTIDGDYFIDVDGKISKPKI